jgi:hypothetical protein
MFCVHIKNLDIFPIVLILFFGTSSHILDKLSHCECHIRMHVLIVLKSLFLANEASNPTWGITCLILYELDLVLLSHDPLLDFGKFFYIKES